MIDNNDSDVINEVNSLIYKISSYLKNVDLDEDDYIILVNYLNQLSGLAFESIIMTYAMQDILFEKKNYHQRKAIRKEISSRIKEIESEYEFIEESYNVNNQNGFIIPFTKISGRRKL